MQANYDYCQALVRERDREHFLATLFAPAAKRPHLFALYAFDLEIVHVPDAVREPMAGEIRFQWWREALSGERAEEAKANPVASALLDTMRACGISSEELVRVIDARQFDLLGQPMESREKLDAYLSATTGAIVALAARVLDGAWQPVAARHAGGVIGLTRILRNFARDVSRGRLFVPLDLLAKHDVHTASVLGGENSPGLRAALGELRENAKRELAALRAISVPNEALPAFLPVVLTPLYLAQMEKAGYDPFRSDVRVSAFRTQLALWRAARSGRV
jgi:phytoene synthase